VQTARLTESGLGVVTPAQAEALLDTVVGRAEAGLVLTPISLGAMSRELDGAVPPVWRTLVRTTRRTGASGVWAKELGALPPASRDEAVREAVRAEVARVLSLGHPDGVAEDRPLQELGLDSLTAVELGKALGRRAGLTLPATLAFDYPTAAAIGDYLLKKLLPDNGPRVSVASTSPARSVDEPIAIVGMGCRYPGGITDPETFWGVLDGGIDAVAEVPAERWDIDALYDPDPDAAGKMVTRSGGFVRGIDRFDAGFFGISPREAVSLDPQQRLLLETSWEALERAGMTAEQVKGSSTGVFVGLMYQDYATLAGGLERLDGYVGTGSAPSLASGASATCLGCKGRA
jgi:epothilone polyketide synthase D